MSASGSEDREHHSLGIRALLYISGPVGVLCIFFAVPMGILFYESLRRFSLGQEIGFAGWSNYVTVIENPAFRELALNTVLMASIAMAIMLALAVPLAYVLAFRLKRFEVQFLLFLVLADQLNPLIRVYAWRAVLGVNGVVNSFLEWTGIISQPVGALLFSKVSVVIVLSGTYVSYTTIPIYAAFKAVDFSLIDAAGDLGAGLITTFRRILLPLAAPGIFVAIILVYIPLYSEFVTPSLVGGASGYMIGNAIEQEFLVNGDWGVGSALSFVILLLSVVMAIGAYRLARVRRLETAS
jgi:ABC-type spermidine/putrescine transport system permease subunit I